MRLFQIALSLFILAASPLAAQQIAVAGDAAADAETAGAADAPPLVIPLADQTLADFKWQNRLVVVFADTPLDPAFIRQLELLAQRPETLTERDALILTDTDPAARTPIRLELRPRGFALVLVDKDSRVIQRKPSPWDLREITRAIDKTPLRQQELRDQRDAEANRQGVRR
jgi:hypothetical protein